jgi:glycopeptide antibiotics resistance protein
LEKKTRKHLGRASLIVFMIYIGVLIYFVFFSDRYGRLEGFSEYRYNLTPFLEIKRYLEFNEYFTWENLLTNLVGNILVFSPMGILIPIFMERKVGILYIGGASFLLSFFIETVQLIFKIGVFDVDDLIMNTLGGLIGYVIYRISQANYRRYLRRQIRKRKCKKQ